MENSGNIELFPVGISHLTSLQTLKGVVVSLHTLKGVVVGGRKISSGHGNALKFTDLKGLRLLQHLSLTIENVDDALSSGIQLEEGIFGGMTKMRSLDMEVKGPRFLHLPKDMEVMKGLEIVRLWRCVVPKWIFQLQNLMELDLGAQNFSAQDCKSLTKIPHLKKMVLRGNDECIEFPKEFGEPMAFPKLEWLEVKVFKCLEKFPSLPENPMPMLKHLEFCYCNRLKNMPEGLERLQSLQEVLVWIELDNPREAEDLRNAHCWQILEDRQIKIDLRIELRRAERRTRSEDNEEKQLSEIDCNAPP
jgi:Leucine-rich repeat (LRR) protein